MSLPREGEVRIPSGCAVSGMFSKSGKRMNGEQIIRSIEVMHDRSNGLGGGFAQHLLTNFPSYHTKISCNTTVFLHHFCAI